MQRSQETIAKIQEFFGLCAYHLTDVGVRLAEDTSYNETLPDPLVTESKRLIRFLVALDSGLNVWTDKEVERRIEATIATYGLKNYPVVAIKAFTDTNIRTSVPVFSTTGGNSEVSARVEDQGLTIRVLNGQFVMSRSGIPSFLTIAAREEVVNKDQYNTDKQNFATKTDIQSLSNSISTQGQRVSQVESFQGSFTGAPQDILYKTQVNQPNLPVALNAEGKVSPEYLPNEGQGEVFIDVWNALTNTPAIPSATPENKGNYYRVSVAGNTEIDGFSDWQVDAKLLSDGSQWIHFPPPGGTGSVTDTPTERNTLDLGTETLTRNAL